MATKEKEKHPLSPEEEDELIRDESKEQQTSPMATTTDPLVQVMQNLNSSLEAMAGSMQVMQRSLKRLHSNVPEDHSSHPKKKRAPTSKDISSSEEDDDSDKDIKELYGDDSKQHNAQHEQTDDNDPLLSEIAEELQSSEDTGPAIDKKHAEIINKQWCAKLPDAKLKDKYGKYLRPSNCETLTTARVNPEIWDNLSHSAKQHDLRSSSTQKTLATVGALLCKSTKLIMNVKHTQQSNFDPDLKTLIKMNTDAVALLGHAHIEMSHRRRESIKPHLNKEYAGLCASHVPVTTFLFGDDLQARLNSI